MDIELSYLCQIFDHFPEPVFFLRDFQIIYKNSAGKTLVSRQEEDFLRSLYEMLPKHSGNLHCALDAGLFHITLSVFDSGRLIVLRPVKELDTLYKHTNVPAQLRGHLSSLAATIEHLAQQLNRDHNLEFYQDILSIQIQAMYRILRLTRQMELSHDDWEQEFPIEPVDLAGICHTLSSELTSRIGSKGPHFTYRTDLRSLLLMGNKGLLEQLILSLISNGIKSAGTNGIIELSLTQKNNRAVISVWDNGLSIPEDRLLNLFSPQNSTILPRPNEGAGLDLWIAHRIALFHHGVIMAGNRPQGGTEFTISLPIQAPNHLRFQSDDTDFQSEGFSTLLIGLADALPRDAFNPLMEL